MWREGGRAPLPRGVVKQEGSKAIGQFSVRDGRFRLCLPFDRPTPNPIALLPSCLTALLRTRRRRTKHRFVSLGPSRAQL